MTDLVECPRCPWKISPVMDGWEEALAAHELAHWEEDNNVKPCKIPGCDQAAAARSGMYALLCATHADEKKQLRGTRAATTDSPASNGHALLEDLGRAVDQARRQLDEALSRLRDELD